MVQLETTTAGVTESIISDDPLKALDSVIQESQGKDVTSAEQNRLKDLALRCILAVGGYVIQDKEDIGQKALDALDGYEELDQKKIVAVCFLRLLPQPGMKWLSDKPWRPRVVALLDSQFAEDLYRDQKVDAKSLAHKKMDQLAEIVRKHEQRFRGALQMLTSLDRMRVHRQKLMSAINSRVGRILVHPFLPGDIEGQLGELYKRVEIYLERRDDLDVVDAHAGAIEEMGRFVQALEAKGTMYSQCLAEQVGRKLITLIEEDFASNKAAQPTTVSVEARDKKYPLHLVGQLVNLGFTVKNQGPGYAHDTKLAVVTGDENINLSTDEVGIGRLAPATIQLIEIPSEVLQAQEEVPILVEVKWCDFDGTQHTSVFSLVARAQRSDIDWERLAQSDPYSLEPVTTEQELVGRRDVLNRLIGTAQASNVGSSIIQGQKRVGKTSIAKVLRSHLEGQGYLVIYLDNYVEPSARATVARLGTKVCKEIARLDPRLVHIGIPEFDESLSPLADFLEEVTNSAPDCRIVIILDEFDKLPLDLYALGPLGDAFFLTLRSISSRPRMGFVLVGGEKMAHVMDYQGSQLNKWISAPVDYFTREADWTDYRELVQRPVGDTLEYTEDALNVLHDVTAGNPFFAKLVCQFVLQIAVKRRDCYITRTEIDQAVETALRETDRNAFQHFWQDGIFATGTQAMEKSIRRRKILIALSDVLAKQSPASRGIIAEHPLARDIATLDSDLREFVTRKVLLGGTIGDTYDFKVRLFHKWLEARGVHDVIVTFSDLDAALRQRQKEEQIKVQPSEIVDLVGQWPTYKGQTITGDKVRAWLDQFGGVREQRAMFAILKGLHFYSNDFVRQKMAEVDGIVRRGLLRHMERGKLKRSDILVSYLDSPGKSGAHFARLYADEASIYVDNIVEKGKLAGTLRERTEIQALVFIDDFVATGQSASEYLQELDTALADVVRERSIKVVFVAVVAFVGGWKRVEQIAENLGIRVQLHACEILDESAKCFSENSSVFADPNPREFAKEIALRYGKMLEKRCPLGRGDLEMAVVFERRCPNNSLPILWSELITPKWMPLFKRH
ncbi:MAG: ATP-binding protein [Chloroflexi bacterium]|nr:ATP-binding protein [Chloroflexota bacterium]